MDTPLNTEQRNFFSNTKQTLPLQLKLLTRNGYEYTHLDFNTINKYNLFEIYSNTGSQDVMKYLLEPAVKNIQ